MPAAALLTGGGVSRDHVCALRKYGRGGLSDRVVLQPITFQLLASWGTVVTLLTSLSRYGRLTKSDDDGMISVSCQGHVDIISTHFGFHLEVTFVERSTSHSVG